MSTIASTTTIPMIRTTLTRSDSWRPKGVCRWLLPRIMSSSIQVKPGRCCARDRSTQRLGRLTPSLLSTAPSHDRVATMGRKLGDDASTASQGGVGPLLVRGGPSGRKQGPSRGRRLTRHLRTVRLSATIGTVNRGGRLSIGLTSDGDRFRSCPAHAEMSCRRNRMDPR